MNPIDNRCVNTIRVLSAEAIQKSKSGHPGLPLGAAPAAYTLFAEHLVNDPTDLSWANRDRFVLSAGHGSMLLYSLYHLFGYGLTMEDLKQFRQFGSKTPGHPEYRHTKGVEVTTGPLGMGVANAVGMAAAEAHLAARFNRPGFPVVDHYTFALTGDGCLEEGISSEASSLAGTWKLGKLILLYDRNKITIEGSTDLAFTEDVAARYAAYGWQVLEVEDANTDLDAISAAIAKAKAEPSRPTIIINHTTIGYGCPNVAGTSGCHGSPLGDDNIAQMKVSFGMESPAFTVSEEIYANFRQKTERSIAAHTAWSEMYARYKKEYPELAAEYEACFKTPDESLFGEDFYAFEKGAATRSTSGVILNRLNERLPNLIGGSADLAPSNNTALKGAGDFSAENYAGKNMHFGVREFAMAAICNGMAVHGGLSPYCATFFVFSDYLKHAIRLAALMQAPTMFVLTHDSIGVGEDGPTHEPIEQLAGIRAIPGVYTFRPADGHETAAAYEFAETTKKPIACVLSRQNLPLYEETGKRAKKGAYIVRDARNAKVILIGTGSELELCYKAYDALAAEGIPARVVSMPCCELFDEQSAAYREEVLPAALRARVCVEAASTFGWAKYAGLDGEIVGIDTFGASAPAGLLFEHYGFTVENVVAKAKAAIAKNA